MEAITGRSRAQGSTGGHEPPRSTPSVAEETRREWALMLHALTLTPAGSGRFTANSFPQPGRIFGGQLVGQAVLAAAATAAPEFRPTALQCTFLRAGDPDNPVRLDVIRMHHGRSFACRRVDISQQDQVIFTATVTLQVKEDGPDHQAAMPAVPQPEDVPSQIERMAGHQEDVARFWGRPRPVELRHVSPPAYLEASPSRDAHQHVWLRCGGPAPSEIALAAAICGFVSDYAILEPVLRRHGLARTSHDLRTASLNHSIWWHRLPLLEEWMLYAQESPSAQGARGVSIGRLHGRDGRLIALVAQEGLYRGTHARGTEGPAK